MNPGAGRVRFERVGGTRLASWRRSKLVASVTLAALGLLFVGGLLRGPVNRLLLVTKRLITQFADDGN